MSEKSRNNSENLYPPVAVEALEIEPFMLSYRDEIYKLMFDRLAEQGHDPETLVFTGIDGTKVAKTHTFGQRDRTYGMTGAAARKAANDDISDLEPVRYMETEGGTIPAIAVYDANKLLGGYDFYEKGLLEEPDVNKLKDPDNGMDHWMTRNGESLDSASIVVFTFDI